MSHNITNEMNGTGIPALQYYSPLPSYTQGGYYAAATNNVRKEVIQIKQHQLTVNKQLVDLTNDIEQKQEQNASEFNYLKGKLTNINSLEENTLDKLDYIEDKLKPIGSIESRLSKINSIEEKLKTIDTIEVLKKIDAIEQKLQQLDYIPQVMSKLESMDKKSVSVNNKLNNKLKSIERNNDEINEINRTQSEIQQNILAEISNKRELKEMKNTLNEFIEQQKEINEDVMDEKQQLIHFLTNEVQLPQYIPNFESQGFRTMDTISSIDLSVLELMDITKMGDQIQILQHIKKYKKFDTINYFNDSENIQMLRKKLKKVQKQFEQANMCISELESVALENKPIDLSKYHRTCDIYRKFVLSKFEKKQKKSKKKKEKTIIEADTDDKQFTEYVETEIKKYAEFNPRNAKDPIIANSKNKYKQSELITMYKIENHKRIKGLNGQFGAVALDKIIHKNTVIGEYNAVNMLKTDLDQIQNAEIVNQIDSYGFDAEIYCDMTSTEYNCILEDNIDEIMNCSSDYGYNSEPPSKKRKLNNSNSNNNYNVSDDIINTKIEIVIDGYNHKPRSLLTYINDCRKSLKVPEPTIEDKQFYNIKLITCDVNGWPRVFGVALRDIQPHEELSSYYGSYFWGVQVKADKLKKKRQKIMEIVSKTK